MSQEVQHDAPLPEIDATQLLEEFEAEDEHGNTIILTSEQMQSLQEVSDHATQKIVNEILETEEMINNSSTIDTHAAADDALTQVLIGTPEDDSNMQDLILHTVDSEGNLIVNVTQDDHDHGEQEEHVEEMEVETHEPEHEHEEETVVVQEESETNEDFSNSNNIGQDFLSVEDSVFNPETGTLQPIYSLLSSQQAPQQQSAPVKKLKKIRPNLSKQQGQMKFVINQSSADGQTQQVVIDADQLQGLLQGSSSTITLGGSSGKKTLLMSTPSHTKLKLSGKSPPKILPAPVPAGDQQTGIGTPGTKYLIKQGNILTPISTVSVANTPKFIQMTRDSSPSSSSTGNKSVQYVRLVQNKTPGNKVPIAPNRPLKPVAPKKIATTSSSNIISLPAGTDISSITNLQSGGLNIFSMIPNYIVKSEGGVSSGPVPIRPSPSLSSSSSSVIRAEEAAAEAAILSLTQSYATTSLSGSGGGGGGGTYDSFRSLLEPNGMRPRKPCNCTKSQCLKLYCECFANGEFCHLCNCNNCFNNLNHEEERQKAIKLVLERNPIAFRPKIGKSSQMGEAHERRHNKGCNCRRSGCLKNYCECYEAKIFCSGICKCSGCKNCIENIPSGLPNGVGVEQHFAGAGTSHRQTLKDLAEAAEVRVQQQTQVRNKMKAQWQDVSPQNNLGIMVPPCIFRYPKGSISYEIITSTVELLLAKAEAGEKQKLSQGELEKSIIEEFADCIASLMELGTTIGGFGDN